MTYSESTLRPFLSAPDNGGRPGMPGPAARAEKLRVDLAIELSHRLSHAVTPRHIGLLPDGGRLKDSTAKLTLSWPDGTEKFILVSGTGNPDLVARACRNIDAVRARLPKGLRAPVLTPEASGGVNGLSYAVWPRHRPLSRNKILHALQCRRLAPAVCDWLFDICHASAAAPDDPLDKQDGFEAPLEFLMNDARQPRAFRSAAEQARAQLGAGTWTPRFCIQHSDFWIGNILQPSTRARHASAPFFVIDWAGAKVKGYPFIDLVRFLMSVRAGAARSRKEIDRHCVPLACEPEDAIGYCLCALGRLGENPEFFPEKNYLDLCLNIFDFMQRTAIGASRGR